MGKKSRIDSQPKLPTRLFLIDERILMLELLHAFFASHQDFDVVGTATRAEHARTQVEQRMPAVALIDVTCSMEAGFELARKIASDRGPTSLVILDDRLDHGRVSSALSLGAHGYFLRQQSSQILLSGLRQIALGQRVYDPLVADSLDASRKSLRRGIKNTDSKPVRLTPREIEVLCHLAQGLSVSQCAAVMKIAHSTVDNHKSRMMRKLGVNKSTQLALIAVREGLIPS